MTDKLDAATIRELLPAIETRERAATLGPWVYFGEQDEMNMFWGQIRSAADDGHFDHITDTPEYDERDKDMEFIANAREDIPKLLAIARYALELSDKVEELQEIIDGAMDDIRSCGEITCDECNLRTQVLRQQVESQAAELERLRGALEILSLADPCECEHDNENCCARVGEPCATCALSAPRDLP